MCNDCKNLVAVGCDKVQCYCLVHEQLVCRPDITACSEEEERNETN